MNPQNKAFSDRLKTLLKKKEYDSNRFIRKNRYFTRCYKPISAPFLFVFMGVTVSPIAYRR